jgi:energy-converting hydrogenase Eha subunit C
MYSAGWLWCAFMLGGIGTFAIWTSKHPLVKMFDFTLIALGFLAILLCGKV